MLSNKKMKKLLERTTGKAVHVSSIQETSDTYLGRLTIEGEPGRVYFGSGWDGHEARGSALRTALHAIDPEAYTRHCL